MPTDAKKVVTRETRSTGATSPVVVTEDRVQIPTYEPAPPDKHPMFLNRRVYQGSSGKVYPLPVYNRIAETPTPRAWRALHIENEFIRLMMLPEIGGRIHIGQDKTNGYDFFYRQNVIKPALVGLAGPWASGGVEFNWPQHHRPATFMPVSTFVENSPDGSKTIWFSDHDPMVRMKGMHGVCLHPGKAVVELKVRAYNRTPYTQTFLWWANVATRVHEGYQSFFPTDVTRVADHAKRAMSTYPLAMGHYYGVDYGSRAKHGVPPADQPSHFPPPYLKPNSAIPSYAANDLQWYANIPVPTSYMCIGSKDDFFGGYDHLARAGVVHVANHHISPGKKQWTWGNHDFGYAWDRNLTDHDGPYIELMAGVYTDNQPDFSYLQPGETKTWSQFWYPIKEIGPVQKANVHGAISLRIQSGSAQIGVVTTSRSPNARIEFFIDGKLTKKWTTDLSPTAPFLEQFDLRHNLEPSRLRVVVRRSDESELISYQPSAKNETKLSHAAVEPAPPREIASNDELYVTGLHLAQYRHATRKPEPYWLEVLRRDAGDARCNNALGLQALRRGQFTQAKVYFETAIARLTHLNPNPYDGEPFYNLGLTERFLGHTDEAYAAFYKATWNQAWQSAAYHAIAEIDCTRGDWILALDHLDRALRLNTDDLRARDLRSMVLAKLGRDAKASIAETLAIDPLDQWALALIDGQVTRDSAAALTCDTQTHLDLALDLKRAGFTTESIIILETAKPDLGTEPLVQYHLAALYTMKGDLKSAAKARKRAAQATPDYCFPFRLEDISVLENADATDARAPYYLGTLYYDKDRFEDGLQLWEKSVKRDPNFALVWRNLGIAYFNIAKQPKKALAAFERAFSLNSKEPRLLYERDQLWKRLGLPVSKRIKELMAHLPLVQERDDLAVELCTLYNQMGQPLAALEILKTRTFQPWEGGEGLALGQYVRAHMNLGEAALRKGAAEEAREHFEAALQSPKNLGEAKHLLANQSDIHLALGDALSALGRKDEAKAQWRLAATYAGDFQGMSVKAYSEMTAFTAEAMKRLGQKKKAEQLLTAMLKYARALEKQKATIDYFATSLPTLLLFEDDIQARQTIEARVMQALALRGLGQKAASKKLLLESLKRDPAQARAADLISSEGRL